MKIKVEAAKKPNTIDLIPTIFQVEAKPALLAQVVQRNLANRRRAIAHSKDRGEVSGSGRKPYRQKGTGRARAGSVRSPIWVGGGVVFGPRASRNFQKRLPRKMLRRALCAVLSEKFKNHQLIVVESLEFNKISTTAVQAFLEKLPIEEGKILVILAQTNVNFELSVANLPFLKVIQVQNINILDILKFDYILTDTIGIMALQKMLAANKSVPQKSEQKKGRKNG